MARSRSFVRGVKRHGDWSSHTPQTSMSSLAANSVVLSQTFTPTGAGETVIRTRGLFGWGSDQQAASEEQMGAVGIGIVSAQAVSVGITAIPHPDTDVGWSGWLWHSFFCSQFTFGTAVGFDTQMINRIVIDSKAMRKVGDEERLVVVVENSHGTSGMIFYDAIRIYSKPY